MLNPKTTSIDDALFFSLREYIETNRGKLVPISSKQDIPFSIERVFYVSDVVGDRGHHAHKECHQVLIALTGIIHVVLSDGSNQRKVTLSNSKQALYIPPGIWARQDYESGSMLLVLCSHPYIPDEYIRSEKEYQLWRS